MADSISINLSKNIYGAKGTLRELDEEFKEFAPNIKMLIAKIFIISPKKSTIFL